MWVNGDLMNILTMSHQLSALHGTFWVTIRGTFARKVFNLRNSACKSSIIFGMQSFRTNHATIPQMKDMDMIEGK